MGTPPAARQAELKERRRKAGWLDRTFWIHAEDLERVKAYIAKLTKARGGIPSERGKEEEK